MVEETLIETATQAPALAAGEPVIDFGYTITTEAFSGPLDLLLFLVRRTEVDIVDIPIVTVIDQFVATIQAWQDMDLEVAGDFIAMAATLLEIKARLVAPPPEVDEPADDDNDLFDPRSDLINQLLAYRRFKEASQSLADLELAAQGRCARQFREAIPEDPDDNPDLELGEIDAHLLMRTCETILARINGLGPRTVPIDDVPLTVRIAELIELMRTSGATTMRQILAKDSAVAARLGTVLATLECTRQRYVEVKQFEQYGDVQMRWREDAERTKPAELPPEEPQPVGKRRRRPPLMTYTPPPRPDDVPDDGDVEEEEVVQETDEQRFVRELNELCAVDSVLATTQDVEGAFLKHWYEQHPELKPPEPPAPPEPPPVPEPPPAPPRKPKALTPPKPRPEPTEQTAPVVAAEAPELPKEATEAAVISVEAVAANPALVVESAVLVVEAPAVETLAVAIAEVSMPPQVETPGEVAAVLTQNDPALVEIAVNAIDPVADKADEKSEDLAPATETTVVAVAETPLPAEVAAPTPTELVPSENVAVSETVAVPDTVVGDDCSALIVSEMVQAETLPISTEIVAVEAAPAEAAAPAGSVEADTAPMVEVAIISEATKADDISSAPVIETVQPADEDEEDDEEENDELTSRSRSTDEEEVEVRSAPLEDLEDVNAALLAADDTPPPRFIETGPDAGESSALSGAEYLAAVHEPLPVAAPVREPEPIAALSEPVAVSVAEIPSDNPVISTATLPAADEGVAEIAEPVPQEPVSQLLETVPKMEMETALASDPSEPPCEREPTELEPSPIVAEESLLSDEPAAEPVELVAAESAAAEGSFEESSDAGDEAIVRDELPLAATEPSGEIPEPMRASEPPAESTLAEAHDLATVKAVTNAPVQTERIEIPDEPEIDVVEPALVTTAALSEVTAEPPVDDQPSHAPTAAILLPDDVVAGDSRRIVVAPMLVMAAQVAADSSRFISAKPQRPSEDDSDLTPLHKDLVLPPPDPDPDPPAVGTEPPISPTNLASTTEPTTDPDDDMTARAHLKIWRRIALACGVVLVTGGIAVWATWVPRNVLEVVDAPALGAEIGEKAALSWRFNLDVLPEHGPLPRLPEPLITPAVAGQWQWTDRRTLAFTPLDAWPVASDITVHLPHDRLRSAGGFRMEQPYDVTVHTAPLSVSGATVTTFAPEGTTISLAFAQAVEPKALVATIRAEQAGTALTVTALDEQPTNTVRLRVTGSGAAMLSLPAGFRGIAGALGLASAWSAPVVLGHRLQVVGATASAPSRGEVTVRVALSDLTDLSVVAKAWTISGADGVILGDPDQLRGRFRASIDHGAVDVTGPWEPGKIYQLHVAAQWPGEQPAKALAAYPAEAKLSVVIPHRQPGLWMSAATGGWGRLQIEGVNAAVTAYEIRSAADDALVKSLPITAVAGDAPQADAYWQSNVDASALLVDLPAGAYRIRAVSAEVQTSITVDKLVVPPMQMIAAWREWQQDHLVNRSAADVGLRLCVVAPAK